MKKTWSGRFKKRLNKAADEFNSSSGFDSRLLKYDILSGAAHVGALRKARVITAKEAAKMKGGLSNLLKKYKKINIAEYEDVHSAVEMELVKLIGKTGAKLHTGRSRNDLVATDTRLYLRDEIKEIKKLLKNLLKSILSRAETAKAAYMPGYTHLQQAQVMTAAYWMMGYFSMFKRDLELLKTAGSRADVMPLGSGAFAGANYPLDRKYMAKKLKFKKVSENGLDAVSDRDFVLDFLYFCSVTASHLSRVAEEFIIYNSAEFSFVEIDDSFATGSSIMPQKKNPDIPELMRGKTGKFYGYLMSGLTMMKSLPVSYNKDLQEDKPLLFGAVDELKPVLNIASEFIKNIKFNKKKMLEKAGSFFMFSVDIADYLVGKGLPFREAHSVTGRLVAYCESNKKKINSLEENELKKISPRLSRDVIFRLNPEKSVNMKKTEGSTSPRQVEKQIKAGRAFLRNES